MQIKIDMRETDLIKLCREITDIPIEVVALELGDAIIGKPGLNGDFEAIIIIERKTVADLAASIKDGRYEEQSHRLSNALDHANHNIVYLIEGNIKKKSYGIPVAALYSALFSLNYYKGFSVTRSFDIDESAAMICNMAYKLQKEKTRFPYYTTDQLSLEKDSGEMDKKYCALVKSCKKENITPENISEIMLSQIPNISSVTAMAIMNHFKNIADLIEHIKMHGPDSLKTITYTTEKNQVRKISKTAISNIIKYLI